nr:MAG TPA: hypothetical protein [Caudoviricetes sp.]
MYHTHQSQQNRNSGLRTFPATKNVDVYTNSQ